jgi:hypothetical protein
MSVRSLTHQHIRRAKSKSAAGVRAPPVARFLIRRLFVLGPPPNSDSTDSIAACSAAALVAAAFCPALPCTAAGADCRCCASMSRYRWCRTDHKFGGIDMLVGRSAATCRNIDSAASIGVQPAAPVSLSRSRHSQFSAPNCTKPVRPPCTTCSQTLQWEGMVGGEGRKKVCEK